MPSGNQGYSFGDIPPAPDDLSSFSPLILASIIPGVTTDCFYRPLEVVQSLEMHYSVV